jgi:GxxExxY protein
MNLLHKNITDIILKSYYKVYNNLGYGFLEKVYENALLYELRNQGLIVKNKKLLMSIMSKFKLENIMQILLLMNALF